MDKAPFPSNSKPSPDNNEGRDNSKLDEGGTSPIVYVVIAIGVLFMGFMVYRYFTRNKTKKKESG